jgi:hypothetical protein
VSKDIAPMLKFELLASEKPIYPDIQAAEFTGEAVVPCLFWRVSIADGPCEGWFLDQNKSFSAS